MYTLVVSKVSAGGANLSSAAVMRSGHIDSGTLGGTALLHGRVRSQLALAAPCGQLPQSIGVNVTVRAGSGTSSLRRQASSCYVIDRAGTDMMFRQVSSFNNTHIHNNNINILYNWVMIGGTKSS